MTIKRIIFKYGSLLSDHQKFRIVELAILMTVGGLLETLSVSMILPFMEVVMDPETTMKKPYIKWMCNLLNISSGRSFLVILAVSFAVLYILKNIYLLWEYNIQYKFVYGNMLTMQKRILHSFISRPYEYFLNISSGDVIRIITNDTAVSFQLLITLLSLFTELVISVMLIVAVFIMAPRITIMMAFVLLVLVILITKVVRPILSRAGKEAQVSAAGMNKWLLQSIQGIKELKVSDKGPFFEENFNKYGSGFVNATRINTVGNSIPRCFIEGFCMSTVFAVIAISIYCGTDLQAMIPVLSVVAVAAMRLLPSVNRITQTLASIAYSEPMVDKMIESLQSISGKEEVSLAMDFTDENLTESEKKVLRLKDRIDFENVSYRYPMGEENVLEHASMTIKRGQSVGIVGTTGSGKTTSVDVLLGLLLPQEGQVLVDGVDISEDMPGWLHQIGYIPQDIFMMDDTIRANVAFGEENISDEKVWRALKEAALDDFVRSLPEGLETQIGERGMRLSGGQKQRIGIARALYNDPDVLFFDEATSALDNETEAAIMESVNSLQGKKTMIIIAHRLTTIENCDAVYRVEDKKIVKER